MIAVERPARRWCGHRGFTLIELMLAVALMGIILASLWSSFAAVSHSKMHAENRLTSDEEGRAVMWQLSKELRGMVQTQTQQAASRVLLIGQGQVANGLPLDAISFSTLDVGHRRSLNNFGSEQIVSYSAAPNPQHRGWYVLLRSERSALINQNNPAQLPPPVVLAENVLALHLRYFDGSRWQESWNSQTSPPGQALPIAVSIELEMAAPGGRPVDFVTRVLVPMAIPMR